MIEVTSPAYYDDCLSATRASHYFRKCSLLMRMRSDTFSYHAGRRLLAVAYLFPNPDGELELCLAALPAAASHMLGLCRIAQLTLRDRDQTGCVVVCHVRPGNRAGERMARLTGFVPAAGSPGKWVHIWRGYNGTFSKIVWRR